MWELVVSRADNSMQGTVTTSRAERQAGGHAKTEREKIHVWISKPNEAGDTLERGRKQERAALSAWGGQQIWRVDKQ